MEAISYSYWLSFAWGLVVLAALVGWGCAAARVTRLEAGECPWALLAIWGMAAVIALGGAMALFGLANRKMLIALALLGCGFALAWFRPRGWDWGAALILGATVLLWYAPAVASREAEPYDDYLAYFPFVRRFLETGTLIEPFSFRRLSTYGGHSLLNALSICFGSEKNMNLLDSGLAMVILGGLVYGIARRFLTVRAALAATAAALLIPIARQNTMSQATGVIIWLGIFCTVRMRATVLTGLLLAALCTLRSNYIVCAVAVAAALLLPLGGRAAALKFSEWAKMVAAACAAMLPWALLLYRSSGSLVYPLFSGFQRATYSYSLGASWADRAHALAFLASPAVLFFLFPILVTTFIGRGPHVPFSIAALLTSLMIPLYLPFSDGASVFRYLQPLVLGSLLIAAGAVLKRKNVAFVLGLLMFPIWAMFALITGSQRVSAWASLPSQLRDNGPVYPGDAAQRYQHLEAALPRGASVYAVLPLPSLLDYRAHKIFNADLIGCASPSPGMPFFKGPVELKRYLLSLGIEYIAYNDFDRPSVETGFWRWWWRERASSQNPVLGPMVPYVLDLMGNVDRLAATEGVVARSGDLAIIRLRGL